jgi:hypothetical protein
MPYKPRTNPERERILETLCDWQSGNRATVGCPVESERYALIMRTECDRLIKRLREIDKQLGNELPENAYR